MALLNERQLDYILNESWPAQAVQGFLNVARMPYDAYRGKYAGLPSEAIIPDALEFASNVGILGAAVPRPAGSIGMGGTPTKPGIRAYHSSPHDFDNFDLSKIGTGEGHQAYGHGMYVAESPAVSGRGGEYWKQFWNKMQSGPERSAATAMYYSNFDRDRAVQSLLKNADRYAKEGIPGSQGMDELEFGSRLLSDQYRQGAEILSRGEIAGPRTYEVNINADPAAFLDWDKPLSKQSEAVRNALKKLDVDTGGMTAKDRIETIEAAMSGDPRLAHLLGGDSVNITGDALLQKLFHGARKNLGGNLGAKTYQQNVAESLNEAGIPGIRYFDGNSRGITTKSADEWAKEISDIEKTIEFHKNSLEKFKGTRAESGTLQSISDLERQLEIAKGKMANESGTRNYVVFDPSIIEILRKYGIAGLLGGGALAMGAGQDQAQAQGAIP